MDLIMDIKTIKPAYSSKYIWEQVYYKSNIFQINRQKMDYSINGGKKHWLAIWKKYAWIKTSFFIQK